MAIKRTPGRRLPDKFVFKSIWMVWTFMLGYILAITGVELHIFGDIAEEVNELIKGCGGVATVGLLFTIGKWILDRNKKDDQ